jgi:xylose isomerase
MRTYLLLKERATAFRADPEVQDALSASRVLHLSTPTFSPGETADNLLADRSAFEDFDIEDAGSRDYGITRIEQLMVEHIMGSS